MSEMKTTKRIKVESFESFIKYLKERGDILSLEECATDKSLEFKIVMGLVEEITRLPSPNNKELVLMCVQEVYSCLKKGLKFNVYAVGAFGNSLKGGRLQKGDFVAIRSPVIKESRSYGVLDGFNNKQVYIGKKGQVGARIYYAESSNRQKLGTSILNDDVNFRDSASTSDRNSDPKKEIYKRSHKKINSSEGMKRTADETGIESSTVRRNRSSGVSPENPPLSLPPSEHLSMSERSSGSSVVSVSLLAERPSEMVTHNTSGALHTELNQTSKMSAVDENVLRSIEDQRLSAFVSNQNEQQMSSPSNSVPVVSQIVYSTQKEPQILPSTNAPTMIQHLSTTNQPASGASHVVRQFPSANHAAPTSSVSPMNQLPATVQNFVGMLPANLQHMIQQFLTANQPPSMVIQPNNNQNNSAVPSTSTAPAFVPDSSVSNQNIPQILQTTRAPPVVQQVQGNNANLQCSKAANNRQNNIFSKITDLIEDANKRFNVYGVITSVIENHLRSDRHVMIHIRDETCPTDGEFRVHVFFHGSNVMPRLEQNCIVRLMKLKVESYKNCLDGRVFSSADVTTFPAAGREFEGAESPSGKYNFDDADRKRIMEIRKWHNSPNQVPVLGVSNPQGPQRFRATFSALVNKAANVVPGDICPPSSATAVPQHQNNANNSSAVLENSQATSEYVTAQSSASLSSQVSSVAGFRPTSLISDIKDEGIYMLLVQVSAVIDFSEDLLILKVIDGTTCKMVPQTNVKNIYINVIDPPAYMQNIKVRDCIRIFVKVQLYLICDSISVLFLCNGRTRGVVTVVQDHHPGAIKIKRRLDFDKNLTKGEKRKQPGGESKERDLQSKKFGQAGSGSAVLSTSKFIQVQDREKMCVPNVASSSSKSCEQQQCCSEVNNVQGNEESSTISSHDH